MNCSLYKDRQIYSMIFNDNLIFFIWQRSLWNLVTSFKTSRRPEHTTYYQLVTANPWDPGPSNSYQWRSPGWCCHCCPASGRWNPRLEWNTPHLKPGRFHRFSNSASIPSVSTEWEPRCTRTKIFWRYLVSGSACCWVSLRCWVCLNLRPVGDLPELWMKGTSFFLRPTQRPFFLFQITSSAGFDNICTHVMFFSCFLGRTSALKNHAISRVFFSIKYHQVLTDDWARSAAEWALCLWLLGYAENVVPKLCSKNQSNNPQHS